MQSKQEQKSKIKRDNKYVKSFSNEFNDRFNQYLDEKEEQKQRNPIERVIDEFRMEIEEWKE